MTSSLTAPVLDEIVRRERNASKTGVGWTRQDTHAIAQFAYDAAMLASAERGTRVEVAPLAESAAAKELREWAKQVRAEGALSLPNCLERAATLLESRGGSEDGLTRLSCRARNEDWPEYYCNVIDAARKESP